VLNLKQQGVGNPVYGWAFWQVNAGEYVAQHHAVLRVSAGVMRDVTPFGPGLTEHPFTLFLEDVRVPFDELSETRYPSLRYTPSNANFVWIDEEHCPVQAKSKALTNIDNYQLLTSPHWKA
jgi:hypothetical protein